MTTLDELRSRRPGNRARVDAVRADMEHQAEVYRLRQLREDAGYTQDRLAGLIGVKQHRISQMERGEISTARVDTLRKYIEATGSELEVTVKKADGTRVTLAL